jgi:hypothetical protein
MGLIESSFNDIDAGQLVPSFLTWLFGGALGIENGSIWGIVLVMSVGLVSFLSLKNYRFEKAMAPSGIITSLVALFALKAGWINNFVFVLACVYAVAGIYLLMKKNSGEEA